VKSFFSCIADSAKQEGMRKISVGGLILSVALLSTSGLAQAQSQTKTKTTATQVESGPPDSITDTSIHTRQSDLSVMLWLPWYYGFGVGGVVRYEIPILPDGFIPTINDEFSLEPSFGVAYSGYASVNFLDLNPALYGIWSFNFSKEFRAYFGLGLGANIGVYTGSITTGLNVTYFFWDICAGVFYKLSDSIALRGELGSQGLKAGVAFFF
jgi:hypothetical protein